MDSRAVLLPLLLTVVGACAQAPAKPIEPSGQAQAPNSQRTYVALRGDLPGAESVTVQDFTLERAGGIFHFDQGTFYFYAPVDGRVTGAVFVGGGSFDMEAREGSEQAWLATRSGDGTTAQTFSTLVLRFTDGTAEEIRQASAGAGGAPDAPVQSAAAALANGLRKELHKNLELRLLADILGGRQGGFFLASFHGEGAPAGRNMLFLVDPQGTFDAAPDEVELSAWTGSDVEPWAAYDMQHAGLNPRVTGETLDVILDRSGLLTASAETDVTLRRDGDRVVRLNLYPSLRVKGVYGDNGAPLDFVQESQENDPDFAVILPAAAKAGDTLRLLTVYSGKDALLADGNDTFHLTPGAHDTWYPSGMAETGDLASFHMTFHLPKDLQVVATGKQVSLTPEGSGTMKAVWTTGAPVFRSGFTLGNFKSSDVKTLEGIDLSAYANLGLPDVYMPLQRSGTQGDLSTVSALKGELSQSTLAVQVYSDYFGKLPYDHLALIQRSSCDDRRGWPMLVSLPICGFWNPPVQRQLGLLDYDSSYWSEATPNEVAREWWGNLVGFNGYRSRWMNEAFANFSVGEFLRNATGTDEFRDYWKEQQSNLLQKNAQGVRPIDIGPLTLAPQGSGANSAANLYQVLAYSKGAFILHMLDMLYWTPAYGEAPFKHSMQQFVSEYAGKAATAEDWKASLERTMPKSLDLRGDGKLDWFFDEYVYGTELPHYTISSEFSVTAGITSVHLKLTQSNVSNRFVMEVPLYLQVKDGEVRRIANVVIHGSSTIDTNLKLGKLPSPARTMLLNYNADVLCDN